MPDFKQSVASRFSDKAVSYDRYAYVQEYAAEKLAGHIKDHVTETRGSIFEIGCGTGFVTTRLAAMFPGTPALISDLSPGMLERCRMNLAENGFGQDRFRFEVLDGEQTTSLSEFGLVISGLTFQWFYDFPGWLKRNLKTLKPGSSLVFSYLSDQSFPEWKESCEQLGIPFSGNRLPDTGLIKNTAEEINVSCRTYEEYKPHDYDSMLHFLSDLKRIGASTSFSGNGRSLTPKELIMLNRFMTNGRGCEINYHLVYAILTA